jgi:hypothetical protein
MKELSETQLVNVNRLDFQISILFFIGVAFVILFGFYALLFYKPFEKFRFFFWGYVMTIGLFVFFKAKNYYAIGFILFILVLVLFILIIFLKVAGSVFLSQFVFASGNFVYPCL